VREIIDFPDRNLCDWPPRRQTNVISTVCRTGDEVQRCKFQFHGTTASVIARERGGGWRCRNLVQSYKEGMEVLGPQDRRGK
jgi:hypothetical protein